MTPTRRSLCLAAGAAAAGSISPAADTPAASILDVFARRQSVRRYKSDPVPDEHVRQIINAARMPPTTMNQQPWKFLVVRDKAKIARMRARTFEIFEKRAEEAKGKLPADKLEAQIKSAREMTEGYFTAPVYVLVLVDKQCPYLEYALKHDGPLAAGYLMLAARALGYGTVYLTDGIPDSVSREVLAIPDRYHRVCMTPIGIPDPWPEPKPKKNLNELIAYETL